MRKSTSRKSDPAIIYLEIASLDKWQQVVNTERCHIKSRGEAEVESSLSLIVRSNLSLLGFKTWVLVRVWKLQVASAGLTSSLYKRILRWFFHDWGVDWCHMAGNPTALPLRIRQG